MKKISILAVLVLFVIFSGVCEAKDDFQYWSQYSVKVVDGEKIDLITYADFRVQEDASKLGLYLFSPKLKMDFWKNLSLGLNYTYLSSRNTKADAVKDDYNWQHRFEVEANPSWKIKEWLKLSIRNRYEFRWIEDRGSFNDRFRHRWTATFPVEKMAPIKSIYSSSEGFYDIAEHEYNENRTIPFGINFDINKKASINMYYMVQWKKGSADWSSNQILGSVLSWEF